MAGLPDAELAGTLRSLMASEFVYEVAVYPDAEYAFKHALTEEVAYRSRLGESRARVHRAVAEAIAETAADRLDEHAALIAHHWETAGATLEAARWSARAAGWAGFNDPIESLRHWRRAQALADSLEPGPERDGLALGARFMVVNFAWRLGVPEGQDVDVFEQETAAVYREARKIAERSGNAAMLATLVATYGAWRIMTGHLEEAIAFGQEADSLAQEAGDVGLRIAIQPTPIYARFMLGRYRDTLAAVDSALELTGGDRSLGAGLSMQSPYAWIVMVRGISLAYLGDLAAGRREVERGLKLAREAGDTETEGWSRMQLSSIAELAGDGDQAVAQARQGVELAERTGGAFSVGVAHTFLGRAHLSRGEWSDAEAAAERALALARERHTGLEAEAVGIVTLAEASRGRGDAPRALEVAEEAIAVATARRTRAYEVFAGLAAARARLGAHGAAAASRVEADVLPLLELGEELGVLAWDPQLRAVLADAARLRGDDAAADLHARETHRRFLEMGAPARAAALALPVG